jgi:F-type H+-transporting ATPase subunit b
VSFDASLLVMMGIFWIVYFILRIFFFRPIMDLLEQRRTTVQTAQSIRDQVQADTEERIAAERARLNDARSQAMAAREEERRQAQTRRSEQLAEVKTQVQESLEQAAGELEQQVARARDTLEAQATELGDRMAAQMLGRAV